VLWTRQDKKSRWFEAANTAAITKAANEMAGSMDVYFGVSLQDKKTAISRNAGTRGFADTALAAPGLWLDLDIQGAAHKSDKLPPNLDQALRLIEDFPLKPSILVHSGHGLQAWWLFKELWVFDTTEEQKEAQDLVYRFQATMKAHAEKKGWEIDSTFDLSRVLRLPGTFNRKLTPEPVKVIQENANRYNPFDFEEYLIDVKYLQKDSGPHVDPVSVLAGVPQGQRDNELFRYACRLRNKGMAKEEAEILVCQAAANCTPVFPDAEAREKVASAWKYPEGSDAKQTVAQLKEFPERAFDMETIGALAVLKKQEPGEYGKIKASLKGQINLNDLERAVNKQVADNQKLHIVEPDEEIPLLEDVLPDIPLKNLRRPYKWSLNENGIWQDTKNGPVCACGVPVILTKRLHSMDTGEEKIELGFYRDGKWQYVTAARSIIFNRSGIIQLADKSLPVSSESAKDLVRYLAELERENMNTIPIAKSTNHMGWVGNCFLPGVEGTVILDVEEGGTMSVAHGYREQGTLQDWLDFAQPLREYPIARFFLSAAFATPLLKILNQRVFVIHSWGASRGGKTAALKAALSVWGDPEDVIASFNATKVGIERLAAFYQDLPLGLDERQVVGDNKQGFIESLVYMLGMGKGKARGSKGGGLQAWNYWRTIVLTTGEEPLSADSSTAGIKTRVIELYGLPITKEGVAEAVHAAVPHNFGTAGPAWIRQLIIELKDDKDMVLNDHKLVEAKLKEWYSDKIASHRAAVALVVLGDYYSSQWLFGLEKAEAMNQALEMAEFIMGLLESAQENEDATRAYEYLMSWLDVHSAFFTDKAPGGQRFGFTDGRLVYLYPTAFNDALVEGKFNPRRIIKDWVKLGVILTETSGGKIRHKVRKYDSVAGKQTSYVAVKLPDENDAEKP
jgi:putative DNA primase/helicase